MIEVTIVRTPNCFIVAEVHDGNVIMSRNFISLDGGCFSLSGGRAVILNDLGILGVVPLKGRQLPAGHCYTLEDN